MSQRWRSDCCRFSSKSKYRPKLVRRVVLLDRYAVVPDRKGEVPLIDIPKLSVFDRIASSRSRNKEYVATNT